MLPTPLMPLAAYRQFCLYLKASKAPCDYRTGIPCDVRDPANQTDLATAHAAATSNPAYGIGFVLTERDPFVVFDADKALLLDGTWSPESLELIASFPGAAVEISTSGRGFHIWGSAAHVPPHGCKNTTSRFEMYHTGRYIALGGHAGTIGDASVDLTAALPGAVARWFTPSAAASAAPLTDGPVAEWRGPADDDELLRRMLSSKPSAGAMFGSRATVAELWAADADALARCYPPTGAGQWDGSSADAALAAHLAFWTGKDPERMERMMRRSALRRDKYDRDDYLPRTIENAVRQCSAVYQERTIEMPGSPVTDTPAPAASRLTEGHSFCWPDDQLKLWGGFVYVAEDNKILTTNGEMLDEPRFKAKFGGLVYVLDSGNEKRTGNAWEAFIHSQAIRHPKVDRSTFRPDLEPRAVFESDGLSFVNTYRPIGVRRVAGDPAPFLDHLRRLFPEVGDYAIVLNYVAALVQYKGHKFNWALFLQGAHGNGKSLLSLCVKAAIGDIYCHMPRADGLTTEYNDWLARTIFCGVEDVYMPTGRIEMMEILKPMITLEYQPIRAMRVSQTMKRVCTNFILNSNHKDGIKKTHEDRRIAPIFCAQQEPEDKARDGLTPDYFRRLYEWLERKDGYAIVAEFLHTHAIPAEFGLDHLKGDAPVTSSTKEAIERSAGPVDSEVLEAVATHRVGFCGGWVSSIALDELLRDKRMESMCPRGKRPDLMKRLGFVHHPHLYHGRATKPVAGGARPVFYIRKGHPNAEITDGAEVTKAYEKAQMHVSFDAAVDKGAAVG